MPQPSIWTSVLKITEEQRNLFVLPLMFCMLFAACSANAADYFVDPNGNDTTGDGSIGNPWKTISMAVNTVISGDIIYVRGGRHYYSEKIPLANSGMSSAARLHLFAYPGERPILDFSAMTYDSSNRGISLSGNYWHIRGIDIYNAGDNGMNISGSNNIIESCAFYENRDAGLQLDNGAANNQIINCDSYYNYDPPDGEDADGFAPKLTVGTGNYFYGCRAWQNSDDGWDGYLNAPTDNVTTTLENCWSFKNGYIKGGGSTPNGDGNGFKMGSSTNHHNFILKNCLAFSNKAKGFDQNHNKGSMHLYNCTAFQNGGSNYSIYETLTSGYTAIVTNCLYYLGSNNLGGFVVQTTNSWQGFTVTSADFASIDPSAAYGPRNADGSLPNIPFMRLAGTSDLIDGGTDVGLPYHYDAPDLGAFEYIDGDCQPDGRVDLADLQCLADNWLDDNCGSCGGADFYNDDTVNFLDFAIVAENWMQ